MKSAVLLAVLLFATPETNVDRAYSLKGETPGMTLKEFKNNHKDADCSPRTARITSCRAYSGVSFAGMESFAYKHCALPECEVQGITANFFDSKLIRLAYGVSGSYVEMVKILQEKFGKPTEENSTATTWRNSVGYLAVSSIIVRAPDGSGQFVGVSIVSGLNDTGAANDT